MMRGVKAARRSDPRTVGDRELPVKLVAATW
jgi:hypothetical protein